MRISDWSSDVCSSDLARTGSGAGCARGFAGAAPAVCARGFAGASPAGLAAERERPRLGWLRGWSSASSDGPEGAAGACPESGVRRSEEHTSELQSLMRSSYAVFCLKKKQVTTYIDMYDRDHIITL